MEIQEFIQNFTEQFEDMDATSLSKETPFRELAEWSSLVALSVMAMIDEEYNVQISGDEMRSADTIQALYNLVEKKLQ